MAFWTHRKVLGQGFLVPGALQRELDSVCQDGPRLRAVY